MSLTLVPLIDQISQITIGIIQPEIVALLTVIALVWLIEKEKTKKLIISVIVALLIINLGFNVPQIATILLGIIFIITIMTMDGYQEYQEVPS